MRCRFCESELTQVFADLGNAPPSNSYLTAAGLQDEEVYYPLKIWTCGSCFLTQIDEFKSHADIFSADYAYFSSFSSSWLAHAKAYVDKMATRFNLGPASMVVEVASNDGYLLQYVKERGIPCLGVEPTASTAAAAREKGIDSREVFFGKASAEQLKAEGFAADQMAANNVLAHVPDIRDFIDGFKTLLKPQGVATFEFPHLLQLVLHNQFDTIYHEHFSYLSLLTVEKMMAAAGLRVFDVEELPTHGGSLRVYVCHDNAAHETADTVQGVLTKEKQHGMDSIAFYQGFQDKVDNVRLQFLSFLVNARKEGKSIAAYGAAAKGNTLLNYCGVKQGMIDFACDLSPHKQGKFLPGSHVPIMTPAELDRAKPDYIIILPWNIREEVAKQLANCRTWGAQFVVAVPALEVF